MFHHASTEFTSLQASLTLFRSAILFHELPGDIHLLRDPVVTPNEPHTPTLGHRLRIGIPK